MRVGSRDKILLEFSGLFFYVFVCLFVCLFVFALPPDNTTML